MNKPDENDLSQNAIDSRAFISRMTTRFSEGLTEMLVKRGDTFAFGFNLSEIPEWPMRDEAVLAGMPGNAPMSVVVLVRPQATADGLLEAMNQLRAGEVVEVGGQ